jgi:hypothetical protein
MRTRRLCTLVEVGGSLWRLGSESNWCSKPLLALCFLLLVSCRYPVRYPASLPDLIGLPWKVAIVRLRSVAFKIPRQFRFDIFNAR